MLRSVGIRVRSVAATLYGIDRIGTAARGVETFSQADFYAEASDDNPIFISLCTPMLCQLGDRAGASDSSPSTAADYHRRVWADEAACFNYRSTHAHYDQGSRTWRDSDAAPADQPRAAADRTRSAAECEQSHSAMSDNARNSDDRERNSDSDNAAKSDHRGAKPGAWLCAGRTSSKSGWDSEHYRCAQLGHDGASEWGKREHANNSSDERKRNALSD